MHLAFSKRIQFPGFGGCASTCTIEAYRDGERTIIAAINQDGDKGTSITNAAEIVHWIGILLCRERGVPTANAVHVEIYRRSNGKATFDLVSFDWSDDMDPTLSTPPVMEVRTSQISGATVVESIPRTPLARPQWEPLPPGTTINTLTEGIDKVLAQQ